MIQLLRFPNNYISLSTTTDRSWIPCTAGIAAEWFHLTFAVRYFTKKKTNRWATWNNRNRRVFVIKGRAKYTTGEQYNARRLACRAIYLGIPTMDVYTYLNTRKTKRNYYSRRTEGPCRFSGRVRVNMWRSGKTIFRCRSCDTLLGYYIRNVVKCSAYNTLYTVADKSKEFVFNILSTSFRI